MIRKQRKVRNEFLKVKMLQKTMKCTPFNIKKNTTRKLQRKMYQIDNLARYQKSNK